MCIITPGTLGHNSAHTVNKSSLHLLSCEFSRGAQILANIISNRKHKTSPGSAPHTLQTFALHGLCESAAQSFDGVLEIIFSKSEEDRVWRAYLTHKLRRLVAELEACCAGAIVLIKGGLAGSMLVAVTLDSSSTVEETACVMQVVEAVTRHFVCARWTDFCSSRHFSTYIPWFPNSLMAE